MKILLVNSNRYAFPPVIPIGIEYLATHLQKEKYDFKVLDLFLNTNNTNSKNALINTIEEYNPDIVGISFRQSDTTLYHNNEFFLDDLKELVSICHDCDKKVILGGTGFSFAPEEILEYIKADYGIAGPGELALIKFLDYFKNKNEFLNCHCERLKGAWQSHEILRHTQDGSQRYINNPYSILNGYEIGIDPKVVHHRGEFIDYKKYIDGGGIVGFETQRGCTDKCIYCMEAGTKLIYKNPENIALEVKHIIDKGFNNFHLCDSEFNQNLQYCYRVCEELNKYAPDMHWALYMKLKPFSKKLFELLKKSGAYFITLTLESTFCKPQQMEEIAEFFKFAKEYGIKVTVDLLTGLPYEQWEEAKKYFLFLDSLKPHKVSINNYVKVYPHTAVRKIIERDKSLQKYLIDWEPGTNYLKPVFFNIFPDETISEFIKNLENFEFMGASKKVNYENA